MKPGRAEQGAPDGKAPVGVKICGITTELALQAACATQADWIGLVFYDRSPRHITPASAQNLLARHQGATPDLVGLFVKPDDRAIEAALDACALDVLQIYDTPERASAIREKFGRPVWLSCPVTTEDDLPRANDVDALVIEPRAPASAANPGGNGLRMDWNVFRDWLAPSPWMLAGGLTPDNVGQAIAESGARFVDVSSGVETAPGQKSASLIRNFVKNARTPYRSPCAPHKN
ncbi:MULTISPECIES: phosphoribosylanthranilate isomerase [Asaia]|uniref:phosphoribosylanthranilate isomerase n=1 Tax=Asaia TaxID=91914 RepID=UPI0025542508|nr:phosphoribosylanthranilate isomerase [Asaia sp. HumB]MDL2170835.1 phosphoribosylanthranilate isomerase [Asaia sp. HumB]